MSCISGLTFNRLQSLVVARIFGQICPEAPANKQVLYLIHVNDAWLTLDDA